MADRAAHRGSPELWAPETVATIPVPPSPVLTATYAPDSLQGSPGSLGRGLSGPHWSWGVPTGTEGEGCQPRHLEEVWGVLGEYVEVQCSSPGWGWSGLWSPWGLRRVLLPTWRPQSCLWAFALGGSPTRGASPPSAGPYPPLGLSSGPPTPGRAADARSWPRTMTASGGSRLLQMGRAGDLLGTCPLLGLNPGALARLLFPPTVVPPWRSPTWKRTLRPGEGQACASGPPAEWSHVPRAPLKPTPPSNKVLRNQHQ